MDKNSKNNQERKDRKKSKNHVSLAASGTKSALRGGRNTTLPEWFQKEHDGPALFKAYTTYLLKDENGTFEQWLALRERARTPTRSLMVTEAPDGLILINSSAEERGEIGRGYSSLNR